MTGRGSPYVESAVASELERLRAAPESTRNRTWIERRLDAYARLDPEIARALGGDRFSPPPIHAVGARR